MPAGEASCYRNLIEELAQEAKVFGRYSVPAMPDATNYTDLTVSVGNQVKTQGVHWDLVNLEHRDGDAVIQFDCTTGRTDPYCNDAAFFSGGAAQIRVQWEQDKLGGCFTTTPPACPDNSHCWVCYILFFLLLVFICCGTYAKIVRKHAIKPPPPILINVQDLNGNTHEVEINDTMSVSDIKALIEKLCGVPIEEIRLFNEEFSTFQLEGPKMCGECGLISTGGAPPKTLTMMVTWTLFVREDPPDNAATAKAREMGLDLVRINSPSAFVPAVDLTSKCCAAGCKDPHARGRRKALEDREREASDRAGHRHPSAGPAAVRDDAAGQEAARGRHKASRLLPRRRKRAFAAVPQLWQAGADKRLGACSTTVRSWSWWTRTLTGRRGPRSRGRRTRRSRWARTPYSRWRACFR